MRPPPTPLKSAAELAAEFIATHVYSLSEKEALVRENSNALKLLHRSFAHPYRNPMLRRNDQDTPYYAEFRRLGRLLTLTGDVRAARGDWNGELNTGLDAIRFGEDIPRGGALTARMIGIYIGTAGQRAAWQAAGHVTAAQARAAIRRLEQIQADHLPLWQTLQEEKWAMQSAVLDMFHHPGWYEKSLTEADYGGCIGPCDITPADYPRPLSNDWWRHLGMHVLLLRDSKRTIMRNYADTMDQEIANTRRPYAARPPAPEMPGDPISCEIVPVYDGAWFRERANFTENALLAVVLALHAFRLQHGAYPATLTKLTPTYLHSVPDDPFAPSGPLHYRRVGTNYLLYSVGPDGKDDGGRPIFDAKKSQPDAWHSFDPRYTVEQKGQGDIVAGLNTNTR